MGDERVAELINVKAARAAQLLQIPRPTAHRLLVTLVQLGYVRRSAARTACLYHIKCNRMLRCLEKNTRRALARRAKHCTTREVAAQSHDGPGTA